MFVSRERHRASIRRMQDEMYLLAQGVTPSQIERHGVELCKYYATQQWTEDEIAQMRASDGTLVINRV